MGSALDRRATQEVHPSPPITPLSRSEHDHALIADMVQRILTGRPRSGTEALRLLRDAFPDSSLPLRVAALNMTMSRRGLSLRLRPAQP
jgi:hypothetical protein